MTDYANIDDVKVGDKLVTDGGFTCMSEGEVKEVKLHADGELYIDCAEGAHKLDGQVDDERGIMVGLRKLELSQ